MHANRQTERDLRRLLANGASTRRLRSRLEQVDPLAFRLVENLESNRTLSSYERERISKRLCSIDNDNQQAIRTGLSHIFQDLRGDYWPEQLDIDLSFGGITDWSGCRMMIQKTRCGLDNGGQNDAYTIGNHLSMVRDHSRVEAYAQAIVRAIGRLPAASRVLDLGTGPFCLLSRLALGAGASSVTAIEHARPAVNQAVCFFKEPGLADLEGLEGTAAALWGCVRKSDTRMKVIKLELPCQEQRGRGGAPEREPRERKRQRRNFRCASVTLLTEKRGQDRPVSVSEKQPNGAREGNHTQSNNNHCHEDEGEEDEDEEEGEGEEVSGLGRESTLELLHGYSKDVSPMLAEEIAAGVRPQFSLVVHEILGHIASAEGAGLAIRDLKQQNLCAPGCVFVPRAAATLIAPTEALPVSALDSIVHRYVNGGDGALRACIKHHCVRFPREALLAPPQPFEEMHFDVREQEEEEEEAQKRKQRQRQRQKQEGATAGAVGADAGADADAAVCMDAFDRANSTCHTSTCTEGISADQRPFQFGVQQRELTFIAARDGIVDGVHLHLSVQLDEQTTLDVLDEPTSSWSSIYIRLSREGVPVTVGTRLVCVCKSHFDDHLPHYEVELKVLGGQGGGASAAVSLGKFAWAGCS